MRPERDGRLMKTVRKVTDDQSLMQLKDMSEIAMCDMQTLEKTRSVKDSRRPNFEWISQVITEEVAILVSDMSGFTRTVREHGILHFASIIARKRQLCMPILKRRGAINVFTEGDDIIAIFRDVLQCAMAAVEMQQTIEFVNASLEPGHERFVIKLGGVGVHCGCGIIIDKNGTVSGEPFRGAYYLGETLCDGGNILFSSAVVERVRGDVNFARATFTEAGDDHMMGFEVTDVASLVCRDQIPAADDASHIEAELVPLARRHLPGTDVVAVDAEMAKRHIRTYTVLMFDLDLSDIGPAPEESQVLQAKFVGLQLISGILKRHRGRGLEDLLWIFENAADALLGALEVRHAIKSASKDLSANTHRIEVSGYGIHSGSLLLIDGTDVHWGDPVNTASKLGQDIATGGEILATAAVRDIALNDPRCANFDFVERSTFMSGLDLLYYSIDKGAG